MASSLRSVTPRLAAEFAVIVIGVLVALGVDSWAQARNDRVLEREYLERLLSDAEYDVAETEFVALLARAGKPWTDSLRDRRFVREADPHVLVGALRIVENQRQLDLTRNTLQELIASGRIGLIRSREVRSALAEYDRVVTEIDTYWPLVPLTFSPWARGRIPVDVVDAFMATCGSGEGIQQVALEPCVFPLGDFRVDPVRTELLQDDVRALVTAQGHRLSGSALISDLVGAAARELQATIQAELDRQTD